MNATVHVLPVADLREHDETESCWCGPVHDDVDPRVIVHNALDERERYEAGTRRVN